MGVLSGMRTFRTLTDTIATRAFGKVGYKWDEIDDATLPKPTQKSLLSKLNDAVICGQGFVKHTS